MFLRNFYNLKFWRCSSGWNQDRDQRYVVYEMGIKSGWASLRMMGMSLKIDLRNMILKIHKWNLFGIFDILFWHCQKQLVKGSFTMRTIIRMYVYPWGVFFKRYISKFLKVQSKTYPRGILWHFLWHLKEKFVCGEAYSILFPLSLVSHIKVFGRPHFFYRETFNLFLLSIFLPQWEDRLSFYWDPVFFWKWLYQ